jgi:molybdate-binding protein/DNA-binding XRE family transcriptional regulator
MDRLENTLRTVREGEGLSQAQLAAAAGISRQGYAAIERGRATPSTEISLRLARTLRTSVDLLFRLPDSAPGLRATLTGPIPKGGATPIRADVHQVGERWIARPLTGSVQHPAIHRSLPVANAVITPLPDGNEVEVELLDGGSQKTLVAVGCDPSIAVVAAHLQERGVQMVSHEMGSTSALQELALGNAHIAGCHLLDAATGQYNLPWVRRYLPFPATVVTFAVWDQGLIVAPGNPKQIRRIADLARPDVRIVNREIGSGSRGLLEKALATDGLNQEQVFGFDHEARSHLSVAEAVCSGLVDTGVAVRAAAIALGLDFVPLDQERYDLVIPQHFIDSILVQEVLGSLRHAALRRQIEALGGYDVALMGSQPAAA